MNHFRQSLQYLFSHPSGLATRVQVLQGLCLSFIDDNLLLTSPAKLFADFKHFCAAIYAPASGNRPLQIPQPQSDSNPNRAPGPLIDHAHSHPFCTCSSTICALIIGDKTGNVKAILKQMFVFVYLHKYITLFLFRFYK